MSHISAVLNLQARARRNALQGTRELRALRAEQVHAEQALDTPAAVSPDAPVEGADAGPGRPQER